MPRKARERSATGCDHIMGRGINHAAIYNDDADNMNFLVSWILCGRTI